MSVIQESDTTARDTAPLLGPGRERFPAYVQQDDGENSLEFDQQTSIQSVLHARERVFRVATCCLIACLASLLVGMAIGFSSAAIVELDSSTSTHTTNVTSNLFAVSNSTLSKFVPHSHGILCTS